MKKARFFVLIFTAIFLVSLQGPAFAAGEEPMKITIQDAVRVGLENSVDLKQVQNQMAISDLTLERANYESKKLKDADRDISRGKSALQEAKNAINQGIAPEDITLPNGMVIKKGTKISDLPLDENTKQNIIGSIQQEIENGLSTLEAGESLLDSVLQEAGSQFSDKLNIENLKSLDIHSTQDLMTTMAQVSDDVTRASYDIYKNQIALLIQKSYYDVLKAQKMLEVKQRAMDRAKKQYDITVESYKNGMKAKDDTLLAELYYKQTQIEYQQALSDLNNAMTELKKNMNVPQDTELVLTDVLADKVEEQNLEEGLKSGLANRLEIKKAFGQVVVNDLTFDSVKKNYPEITFQYREAALMKEKARLEYDKTRSEVESSIRESFETMQRAGEMLKLTQQMVDKAREVVDIAEYKYNEGFGEDNSLLKKLDLESSAGTILEVLAAQENLANVEEKVVEVMYGYNLARMKYFNDIGKFVY